MGFLFCFFLFILSSSPPPPSSLLSLPSLTMWADKNSNSICYITEDGGINSLPLPNPVVVSPGGRGNEQIRDFPASSPGLLSDGRFDESSSSCSSMVSVLPRLSSLSPAYYGHASLLLTAPKTSSSILSQSTDLASSDPVPPMSRLPCQITPDPPVLPSTAAARSLAWSHSPGSSLSL